MDVPLNLGEKRESLIILEKIGLCEGLVKSLGTDMTVTLNRINNIRLVLLETQEISSEDKHCIINLNLYSYIYSFGVNNKDLPRIKSIWLLLKE